MNDDFDKFLKDLEEECKRKGLTQKEFKPGQYFYQEEGDILEVFLTQDMYYAKWLNPVVSVFYHHETNEIVGFSLHGISSVIKNG